MSSPYYEDDLVRLFHGDCREITEWLDADVLVTDPPYGVKIHFNHKRHVAGDGDITTRDTALAAWGDRPALVFGSWRATRPAGVRQRIIWDKRGGTGFTGDLTMPWAEVTEEVYVLGQGWTGRRRPNIVAVPTFNSQDRDRPRHPTPKPTRLMAELMACCPPGVVADPFTGSGATLLAARQLGRRVIGVEVEEEYCELIATRLSKPIEEPLFEVTA